MKKDLTKGNVTKTLLLFTAPMIIGNLLQQFYNIADAVIVGRFIGSNELAAVGSAYSLMTFLTSILIGLCMGCGAIFSFYFGQKAEGRMKNAMGISFLLVGAAAVALHLLVLGFMAPILRLLQTPEELMDMMQEYTGIVFFGIVFVFLYNYFTYLLRAVGNSVTPLYFLGMTALLNVVLDLVFVIRFQWGIAGAAIATVVSQAISGVGLMAYTWMKEPSLRIRKKDFIFKKEVVKEVVSTALAASAQQSVMNFGILMIQGLVNSFGASVMAAFAATVKIDSFAYMPAQEFGNAFSLFISQNYGAKEHKRIQTGIKKAVKTSVLFCGIISAFVFLFGKYFMLIFIEPSNTAIIDIGVQYLKIEGACYCGIGILFLLYGLYRGINRPNMSLVLTIISLGTRVVLAYTLAPLVGVTAIWWAIPIGWVLADAAGMIYMKKKRNVLFS